MPCRGAGEEACSGRLRQFEEMERLKLGMQLPKVNFLDELQVAPPTARTPHTSREAPDTPRCKAPIHSRGRPPFSAADPPHAACGAYRGARAQDSHDWNVMERILYDQKKWDKARPPPRTPAGRACGRAGAPAALLPAGRCSCVVRGAWSGPADIAVGRAAPPVAAGPEPREATTSLPRPSLPASPTPARTAPHRPSPGAY